MDQKPLLEENLNKNAMKQFKIWFEEAKSSGVITEVDVAVLTTVDKDSKPHARCMRILDFNKKGFIFYTSLSSNKVKHFTQNPNVSLVYPWIDINRQVIINGTVKKLSDEKSETYFDKLGWWKKVGTIIKKQSSKVASRDIIDNKFNQLLSKYRDDGVHIKKPDHIYVFMIVPQSIEFFQGRSCEPEPQETRRTFSHSDKIRYTKNPNCSKWSIVRYWA